jgi:hypothetical protein
MEILMEIVTRNVNTLFSTALWRLKTSGVQTQTRNGPALYIPEPVLTTVLEPTERVLFYGRRNPNPIFHLMESIWMLAGRDDVKFLRQFNSRIGQFSDDGERFNAPYGFRMRHQFGVDQLVGLIFHLTKEPNSRQAVIQLWDANDLEKDTKDRACNTQMIFAIKNNKLDLTIFNRSNDFWWGYCGANIVHFTVIQEFVAIALGLDVGRYHTVTTNLHLYENLYDAIPDVERPPYYGDFDYYHQGKVKPKPLYDGDWRLFLTDCENFCKNPFDGTFTNDFFESIAGPMARVAQERASKAGNGLKTADTIGASDWRQATLEYILRRERTNEGQ